MAVDYPDLKIISIGAVGTAREVINYDVEMKNRVSEIYVPLMHDSELSKIINKGSKLLNINFDDFTKKNIIEYSNGLASISHQLCLNICFVKNINETIENTEYIKNDFFDEAVSKYVEEESDSIKFVFDKAIRKKRKGKYDNCRLIIKTLANPNAASDGMIRADIMREIRKTENRYPEANLSRYLNELTTEDRGSLLTLDKNSGKYSFVNPFHKAFAYAMLADKESDIYVYIPNMYNTILCTRQF